VHEIDTPPGAEPVAWVFITTEPLATVEQIRAVLEIYRTRWLIEEFFKALKTGCSLENRLAALTPPLSCSHPAQRAGGARPDHNPMRVTPGRPARARTVRWPHCRASTPRRCLPQRSLHQTRSRLACFGPSSGKIARPRDRMAPPLDARREVTDHEAQTRVRSPPRPRSALDGGRARRGCRSHVAQGLRSNESIVALTGKTRRPTLGRGWRQALSRMARSRIRCPPRARRRARSPPSPSLRSGTGGRGSSRL
jgi:hypothetical protein